MYAEEAKFHASASMLVPAITGGAAAVLSFAESLFWWMYLSKKQGRSRSVWPIGSDLAIDDENSDFPHPSHLLFPPQAAAEAEDQPSPAQLRSPTVETCMPMTKPVLTWPWT
jgi:hypothetical protein